MPGASITGSCTAPTSAADGAVGVRHPVPVPLAPSYPLRSPRLALRPVSAQDIESLVAYRSIPEVCRYVPFEPMDAGAVRDRVEGMWARHALEAEGDALTLGVELIASGELIGDVLLMWPSLERRGG